MSNATVRTARYHPTAIALHWLVAALLIGGFALGQYMTGLTLSPSKLQLYSYHKWIGVTAFLLALARLVWRLAKGTPPAVPMPRWQHLVAETTHRVLYLLMLLIPLSGWLMSSAKGFQTVYFGVLPIPDLLEKNKEIGDLLALVHKSLNLLFIAVLAGHIGAALKHHFIDKDDILTRMLPRTAKEN